ncbi:MAG: UDP-N-acetylmuramate dehydrogenase [Gaiellales bacterium]|nr:UDP-N-acetylmuramate dehydrogenase [Gaiellales bacterium]
MAPFTTIGVGGAAALLLSLEDAAGLSEALSLLRVEGVPHTAVGAGSNLVVGDAGYRGVILKLGDGFHFIDEPVPHPSRVGGAASTHAPTDTGPSALSVVAGAGLHLPRLCSLLAGWGLGGLEFCCGIPGTLGGGVAMNAGAHGGELARVVEAVQVARGDGVHWLAADALEWGYRHCGLPPGAVVTAVRLRLQQTPEANIRALHRRYLQQRRQGQPRGARTFGSTFRNPPGESAGRLLDQAGMKGARHGGAEVSTVHANFIVNCGDARAADVLYLMSLMREAVYRKHEVLLEPEVRVLGARLPWETGA